MANWGDYFAQGVQSGSELALKKYIADMENDPKVIKNKIRASLSAYGIYLPEDISSSPNGEQTTSLPGGETNFDKAKTAFEDWKNRISNGLPLSNFGGNGAIGNIPLALKGISSGGMPQLGYDPLREYIAKKQIDLVGKQYENQMKSQQDDEQLVPTLKGMFLDYRDALDEIKQKAPESLKTGFDGYLNRKGLQFSSSKFIDEFPKVTTLMDNIKADATSFAKAAGEQRPTDQDIERFLAPLLNPTARSLSTNIAKAKSMVRRWELKKVNTEWAKPIIQQMEETNSGIDKEYNNYLKTIEGK